MTSQHDDSEDFDALKPAYEKGSEQGGGSYAGRSTLKQIFAATEALGNSAKRNFAVGLGAVALIVAVLGANFGLTFYVMELVRDTDVDASGAMMVKGTNHSVRVASTDFSREAEQRALTVPDSGAMVQTAPAYGKASPMVLYQRLQNRDDDEDLKEVLQILADVKHIKPIRHTNETFAAMAGIFEPDHTSNAERIVSRGPLMQRVAVDSVEVFEVMPAEGSDDEHTERIAVAHSVTHGKFRLHFGWLPMTDDEYALVKSARSLREQGESRRQLFCCSCYAKKRRSRDLLASSSQCAAMINNFHKTAKNFDKFISNLDHYIPSSFEESQGILKIMHRCSKDSSFLGPSTNLIKKLTSDDSAGFVKTAYDFYAFAVASSSRCPGAGCGKWKKFGPNRANLVYSGSWCLTEADILRELFCSGKLNSLSIGGVPIHKNCALFKMYIKLLLGYMNDGTVCDMTSDLIYDVASVISHRAAIAG